MSNFGDIPTMDSFAGMQNYNKTAPTNYGLNSSDMSFGMNGSSSMENLLNLDGLMNSNGMGFKGLDSFGSSGASGLSDLFKDFNFEGLTAGVGAATDIGGMVMQGLNYKAGKDMMKFNQDFAKENLYASMKSYNNQVNDRERSRLASQGKDRYEQISGGTLDQNIAKKNVTATI